MTNEERIKAMSIGELAKFINEMQICSCCINQKRIKDSISCKCKQFSQENCENGIVEWLKQEVEERANG